jgi:LPS-assembly lipoprotein
LSSATSTSARRRSEAANRTLLLSVATLLGACGFQPMYASTRTSDEGPAAKGLAEITVGLIPERSGQLLRLALQERFERTGLALAHRYDLAVNFSVAAQPVGYQPDTSITFMRWVGVATYTLIAQDPARTPLTSGTARSVDGMNIFDQELFASTLEGEAVQRRIAEAVADQIALQLAAYFRKPAVAARE